MQWVCPLLNSKGTDAWTILGILWTLGVGSRHGLELGTLGQRLSGALKLKQAGPKKPSLGCDHLPVWWSCPSSHHVPLGRRCCGPLLGFGECSLYVCAPSCTFFYFFYQYWLHFHYKDQACLIPPLMAGTIPEASFHSFSV